MRVREAAGIVLLAVLACVMGHPFWGGRNARPPVLAAPLPNATAHASDLIALPDSGSLRPVLDSLSAFLPALSDTPVSADSLISSGSAASAGSDTTIVSASFARGDSLAADTTSASASFARGDSLAADTTIVSASFARGDSLAADSTSAMPSTTLPATPGSATTPIDGLSGGHRPFESDPFRILASWNAGPGDTASVRPLLWSASADPMQDALLYRLYRRLSSRRLVRDELQLRPEDFARADSVALAIDARQDSLVAAGAAAGAYYWSGRSGGLRILPPPVRSLAGGPLVTWQHTVDLDEARIHRSRLRQGLEIDALPPSSYGDHLARISRLHARSVWKEQLKESMKRATVKGGRAGLVRISLPFELPKMVRSVFGEGKPNLSVNGSERITFGGRSQWFPHRPTYEFQRKPSKFPQLEMKQDLTIRLKGSIGDKLDVDVDQASEAQTSLANRIGIHYHGYEDEIIQKVDLGNTSLRLPGTEYVSYGGSHTGLFGINAEAKVGDLVFTTIISKEEGETAEKSTSVRSQEQTKTINDYEYVKDRFFFLNDPGGDAYPGTGGPYDIVRIRQGTVILYLDDGDGDTQETFATSPGRAVLNLDGPVPALGDTTAGPYYFQQLDEGVDYEVLIDERNQTHPIVILNRYLEQNSTLGVIYYDEGRQRNVGGVANDSLFVKMIRPRYDLVQSDMNGGSWGPTNRLMLKNVYPLQQSLENWTGAGLPDNTILQDGFELRIHYKGTIAGVEDPDEIAGTRLIRHLGLDYYQKSDAGLVLGQDSRVDDVWIDFTNGYLFFPDLRPFAPTDGKGGVDLRGRPGPPSSWDVLPRENWNGNIYDRRSCARDRDLPGSDTTWTSRYYIEVKYRTPVSELRIDAWDIIEGSEVVTVGSRRLARDTDYRIDYQTGVIRLYDQAGIREDDEIRVTCKHAGGLGTVSKTLLGAAMIYQPEDSDFSMSTSWLYERRGSPDRRPRLGSEPTRIAVGEVAARYARESGGLTWLVDQLPFLNARKTSQISLEGGMGLSFPNPNTRNDLYIDDFEGVADDIYVRLNRLAWQPAGLPQVGVPGLDEREQTARRGEIWWYTPYRTVQEGDLNPTLEYQEANDYRSVLELQIWPYEGALEEGGAGGVCLPEESWSGIVQGLSTTNQDLTRARFLDIWVNDFVPWEHFKEDTTLRSGILHVDIGQVNEDVPWMKRRVDCATRQVLGGPVPPVNRSLDSEDLNRDGQLDLSELADEDSGLDGVVDEAGNSAFDDYEWTADPEGEYETFEDLCEVYRAVNGTEKNGRLDTEDLDGDKSLDQMDSYFEFTVNLADTSFLETDVRRDYAGRETNWTLQSNNGWRRIRIPLSEAYISERVGMPSWDEVKHLRIWFSGVPEWKRIQIGAVEIRSNRWITEPVRDLAGNQIPPSELAANEEDFFPGVYNNKENSDVYYPPFEPHRDEQRESGDVKEREQSLTMEMRNFQPGHVGRVNQPFLRDQDYTGYESLELWLNSTLPPGAEAEFFLRLCKDANADTTDFYEYRVKVPVASGSRPSGHWQEVCIWLTDLSDLKDLAEDADADISRQLEDGGTVRMKGHPYLTRIRRITMGVAYLGPDPLSQGNVWIDELRLANVHKDVDYAMRMQVRTELSDFARLDFSFRQTGADFVSISGGGFNKRKERETSYGLSTGTVPLERLMPSWLDLSLPFSFQQDWSRRVPKYRTNDDLLVEDDPSDRDLTEQMNRNYSLSIGRRASAAGGFARYTIDALRFSGSLRQAFNANPQSRDSTTTRTLTANYSVPFGPWGDIGLYKTWKVRLLPTSLALALTKSERDEARYRRENGDLAKPFLVDDRRTVRSGGLSLSTSFKPITAVTYDFKQSRDLMLRQEASWLGGLNVGRETSRQENLSANYQLRMVKGWIEPRFIWGSDFRGSFNRQGGAGGGGLERYNELTNSRTRSANWDLPVQRLLQLLESSGASQEVTPPERPPMDEGEEGAEGEKRDEEMERPARPASRPSGGGGSLAKWFSVGRTTLSYSLADRSTFNRVSGEPDVAYQLGFTMDPKVERLENYREALVQGTQLKLDAEIQVAGTIGVTARYSDDDSETRSAGVLTGIRDRILPEVNIRWGEIPQKLGMRAYFRSFKANTRFLRKDKRTTREGELNRLEQESQWAPFLDLELGFKSGVTATMRLDRSTRHTEDLTALKRISDRTDSKIMLSAKKSMTITREVTVPLKKTKERITTKLDLTLSFNYSAYQDVTRQMGYNPQVTADVKQYEAGLGGSYQFTRSVTGNMILNYGENADNKNRTRTTRYATVSLSASFSF